MPLIKHIKVDPLLNGYDYRRRNELLNGDYIRHVVNGSVMSIRTLGLSKNNAPSMVIFNTLQSLAEEGVAVGHAAVDAYAHANDILGVHTTQMFKRACNVGVAPKHARTQPFLATDYKNAVVAYPNDEYAWFPQTMLTMGAELVVLLRVCKSDEVEMTEHNSFALGMALKDLGAIFPELEEYVSYLKNKASQDEPVAHAFRHLMTLIRPQEMAAQEARERAERYKDVRSFGTWG